MPRTPRTSPKRQSNLAIILLLAAVSLAHSLPAEAVLLEICTAVHGPPLLRATEVGGENVWVEFELTNDQPWPVTVWLSAGASPPWSVLIGPSNPTLMPPGQTVTVPVLYTGAIDPCVEEVDIDPWITIDRFVAQGILFEPDDDDRQSLFCPLLDPCLSELPARLQQPETLHIVCASRDGGDITYVDCETVRVEPQLGESHDR